MFIDGFQLLTTMKLGLQLLWKGWTTRNFQLLAGVLVIGKCIMCVFFLPGGNLRRFSSFSVVFLFGLFEIQQQQNHFDCTFQPKSMECSNSRVGQVDEWIDVVILSLRVSFEHVVIRKGSAKHTILM